MSELSRTPLPHAGTCTKCRTVPAGPPSAGVIYLCPPVDELVGPLARALGRTGFPVTNPSPDMWAVQFVNGELDSLAAVLSSALTGPELAGIQGLILPSGRQPTTRDYMSTRPLETLLSEVQCRWLGDVLRHSRLETHFQPIVPTGEPDDVFAYECLIRGRGVNGNLIPPGELFKAARTADLLFQLDRQARLTAIRAAIEHRVTSRLFLNFNPSSIYTPSACLRTTFQAVEEAGITPDQITFEVVESEEITDTAHLLGILNVYREAGFGVALDDVGAGYSSLNLLARLRPDYVKLDMGLTRGVDKDPYKARVAMKLLEMARDLGVRTVVEGVETISEWEWAKEHGADYVQGYLFARPAAAPPIPKSLAMAV
jgi:EAL domain-containing protein (putative c-di-GMP-specific phosphodiesterase class I)